MKTKKLRHKVLIQRKEKSRSPTGAIIYDWIDVTSAWAEVEPLSAKELFLAQAAQSETTAKITVRYNKNINIDATMRILYREKIYNISGVISDNASGLDYLTLTVTEGLNNG